MAKGIAEVLTNVHFVQGTFSYTGQDEDELSFNKGDIVIISKVVDGGWWEGTRDGKIGWFPSAYVKDVSPDPEEFDKEKVTPQPVADTHKANHTLVVKNMVDVEEAHVEELKNFHEKYISPLKNSDILGQSDLMTLCGNFEEIVQFHQRLLKGLTDQSKEGLEHQRIGAEFLTLLQEVKELYISYCANHPWAAAILSRENEKLSEFMESRGASSPGIMTLTTMLSKPFVRVEKYSSQLKELERHIEDDHCDFLDIKKSAQAYQLIALGCNETRKRKEMELEMLTGTIEGWEGEPITSLGNIILMTQVFVEKEDVERKERYFCLFPEELVVLFVSVELVGYCFEERHKLADITAKNIDDTEEFFNAIELKVEGKKWKIMMGTPREKDAWITSLKEKLGDRYSYDVPREGKTVTLERTESAKRREIQSMPRWGNEPTEQIIRSYSTGSTGPVHRPSFRKPITEFAPLHDEDTGAKKGYGGLHSLQKKEPPVAQNWSFTRLRPTPPWQPNFSRLKAGDDFVTSPRTMRRLVSSKRVNKVRSKSEDDALDAYTPSRSNTSSRRDTLSKKENTLRRDISNASQLSGVSDTSILEEDMMILSVIEAYCFSARQRQTMNCVSPTNLLPPAVPPHFSFKPVTPPRAHYPGKHRLIAKKSRKKKTEADVSNEVHDLKSQVHNLHKQTLYLRENLEEEREQRRQFEKLLQRTLKKIAPDIELQMRRESTLSTRSSIGGM
ncbi:rho guanine nucleotide exchange factor 7-like isoform X1 [Rhopilema esculentum]|uniref:rho guanine nucleotide exchange factor 7-like isoform X1 n=1 Tax=Rhopilema esculentum TaxID=499914 RepID=UPI0031D6B9CC